MSSIHLKLTRYGKKQQNGSQSKVKNVVNQKHRRYDPENLKFINKNFKTTFMNMLKVLKEKINRDTWVASRLTGGLQLRS